MNDYRQFEKQMHSIKDLDSLISECAQMKEIEAASDPASPSLQYLLMDLMDATGKAAGMICAGQTVSDDKLAGFFKLTSEASNLEFVDPLLNALWAGPLPMNSTVSSLIRRVASTAETARAFADRWHYAGDDEVHRQAANRFIGSFPEQARVLIDTLVTAQAPVSGAFIEAFDEILTEADFSGIVACDLDALNLMIKRFGGNVPRDLLTRHLSAIKKNTWQYMNMRGQLASPVCFASLLDCLNEQLYLETLEFLRRDWGFKSPKVAVSVIVAHSARAPQKLLLESLRFLSCSPRPRTVALDAVFVIPETETGDSLCNLLVYLADSAKTRKGGLLHIPTAEELAVRAIETQVKDQALFSRAVEARNVLESRTAIGSDHTELLFGKLAEFAESHQMPEAALIERGIDCGVSAEDLGMLSRTLTLKEKNYACGDYLGGDFLTEAIARRLYAVLLVITGEKEKRRGG
jgi:hypothetical protein